MKDEFEMIPLFDLIEEDRAPINQKYPVQEVAFLVLVSLICGINTWVAMQEFGELNLKWLKKFMPYRNGLPTRHNIARIIRMVKPASLNKVLISWAESQLAKGQSGTSEQGDIEKIRAVFAIDGKEVRGVKARSGQVLNVVSAFDIENGLTFSTEMGEGKGQEIEMVRNILTTLNLTSCLVTLDSLHCQAETVKLIVAQKGHALIQVKKNQPTLYSEIDRAFQSLWDKPVIEQGMILSEEKAHGREEIREAFSQPIKLTDELAKKWPHIKHAIAIVRTRTVKGKNGSNTTAYYLSTTALSPTDALRYTRSHWQVENNLHWVLDVVMREDASAVHERIAAKNLAQIRRLALNVLKVTSLIKGKTEASNPVKQIKCAFDLAFREKALKNVLKINLEAGS